MARKLRIAQLVLPWLKLPPVGYGGTESVVYNLTEGLVKKGHKVTLFSVGESSTSARLSFVFAKALGLQQDVMAKIKSSFYPLMHVASCFEQQRNFDIIHSHAQFLALPFAAVSYIPVVHTFHRELEFAKDDERDLLLRYRHLNFTSISNSQRTLPLNYISTVYNGVDTDVFSDKEKIKGDFLFWAGRVIDKKGPADAIEVSQRTGLPLVLAGKITEQDYFESKIKPRLDKLPSAKLLGELSTEEMVSYYQRALVSLVPVKWNEPFGLIAVESAACGTPVVGYACGGLTETVVNGKTGYLVKEGDVDGLVEKTLAIKNLTTADYLAMSAACRRHVVSKFSIDKMVEGYERVYKGTVPELTVKTL